MNNVIEYYSVCCDAPPLSELDSNNDVEDVEDFQWGMEVLGLCMCCRNKAEFNWEVGQDE